MPPSLLVTSQLNKTVREYDATTGAFSRWPHPVALWAIRSASLSDSTATCSSRMARPTR